MSIAALSLSLGLYAFDYIPRLLSLEDITQISSLTDPLCMEYISRLFQYLILPGLIAVPFFFWLIPSSWLLDDAGILFYVKYLRP